MKITIILSLIACSMCSCSYYYGVTGFKAPIVADTLEALKKDNRYFILRTNEGPFSMHHLQLSNDKKILYFVKDSVAPQHTLYIKGVSKEYSGKNNMSDQSMVLKEVHLYTPAHIMIKDSGYSNLALNDITRMEIIKKDKEKTLKNNLAGFGIVAGSLLLVFSLVIAIAASSISFL